MYVVGASVVVVVVVEAIVEPPSPPPVVKYKSVDVVGIDVTRVVVDVRVLEGIELVVVEANDDVDEVVVSGWKSMSDVLQPAGSSTPFSQSGIPPAITYIDE